MPPINHRAKQTIRLLSGVIPFMTVLLMVCTPVAHAETAPTIDGRIDPLYGSYVFYSPEGAFIYAHESTDAISFCLHIHPAVNDNVFAPQHTSAPGWGRDHWFKSLLQSDLARVVLKDGSGNVEYDFVLHYLFDTGIGETTDSTRWGAGVWPSGKGWTYDGRLLEGAPLAAASSLEWNLENEDTGFDVTNGGYPCTPSDTKYWISPSPFDAGYSGNWEFDMIYEFQVDKSAFGANGFGSIEITDIHNSPEKGPVPLVPEVSTLVLASVGLIGIGGFSYFRRKRGTVESERRIA